MRHIIIVEFLNYKLLPQGYAYSIKIHVGYTFNRLRNFTSILIPKPSAIHSCLFQPTNQLPLILAMRNLYKEHNTSDRAPKNFSLSPKITDCSSIAEFIDFSYTFIPISGIEEG